MKILFTADWHISERHGFGGANTTTVDQVAGRVESAALRETRRGLDKVVDAAKSANVDLVIHLGDVFDRAQPTPAEYALALHTFTRLSNIMRGPVPVIQGNHDRSSRHDALDVLEEAGSAIAYRQPGTILEWPGIALYALPYPRPGSRLTEAAATKEARNAETNLGLSAILADLAADAAGQDRYTILCAHVTFAGCEYNPGYGPSIHDIQVPITHLGAFDAALAGHIHLRQDIGPSAHYVGPVNRWGFGDAKNSVGVDILDTETGEFERIEFAGMVDFRTITIHSDEFRQLADSNAGAVLRIVGEVSTQAEFDEIVRRTQELGDDFLGCRNDVTIKTDREQMAAIELDSVADVFEAFNESRPDAIPEAMREHVLTEAKRLHAQH